MTEDHHGAAREPADAADNGLILGEEAVSGERREILDQRLDVVAEMRTFGMARNLRLLPGGELGIGLLKGLPGLPLELGKLLLDGNRVLLAGERFQLGDLAFELGNRLFEIEIGAHQIRPCPFKTFVPASPKAKIKAIAWV